MKLEGYLGLLDSQSSEYLEGFHDRLKADNIGREVREDIKYILESRANKTIVRPCRDVCGGECKKQCKNLV